MTGITRNWLTLIAASHTNNVNVMRPRRLSARALKNFATQIIDGHHDGTLWIPGSAGNA
jgi:hypothetical protein